MVFCQIRGGWRASDGQQTCGHSFIFGLGILLVYMSFMDSPLCSAHLWHGERLRVTEDELSTWGIQGPYQLHEVAREVNMPKAEQS